MGEEESRSITNSSRGSGDNSISSTDRKCNKRSVVDVVIKLTFVVFNSSSNKSFYRTSKIKLLLDFLLRNISTRFCPTIRILPLVYSRL